MQQFMYDVRLRLFESPCIQPLARYRPADRTANVQASISLGTKSLPEG
jgi:hypothetical protein